MANVKPGVTQGRIDGLELTHAPDDVLQLVKAHHAKVQHAFKERYTPEKLDEIVRAAENQLEDDLEAVRERVFKSELGALDTEAAAERARARAVYEGTGKFETESEKLERLLALTDRARRATETATRLEVLRELEDADDVIAAVEDVILSQDPHAIQMVGMLGLQRLARLERREAKKPRPEGPWVNPYTMPRAKLAKQLGAWNEAHPTPRVRLAAIEKKRSSLAATIQARFDGIKQHLQLDPQGRMQRGAFRRGNPTEPVAGSIVSGSAFERR